jgi:hypothetical protein
VYHGNNVRDETHAKQLAFYRVVQYYDALFKKSKWHAENVTLRIYIDDSLYEYEPNNKQQPKWRDVIEQYRTHPNFDWVRFECPDPRFREADGKHHRGLLGTLIRAHAMYDFEENKDYACVCCIDIDSVYTKKWWDAHIEFEKDAKGKGKGKGKAQAKKVMAVVGDFEMPMYCHLDNPPSNYVPVMHSGLTSIAYARLPAKGWLEMPRLIEESRSTMRYLDALRYILYGDESARTQRFHEDFAYGFDETLLNLAILPPDTVRELGGLREIHVDRNMTKQQRFFKDKLIAFLKWNGARSVPMQELSQRMTQSPDVESFIERLRRFYEINDATWEAFEARVIAPLRKHRDVLGQLQIDQRLLHLVDTFSAVARRGGDYGLSSDYIYDLDPTENPKNTRAVDAAVRKIVTANSARGGGEF